MTALIEVGEVELSGLDHDRLLGFGIDRPRGRSEHSTYSLPVRGWVLGHGNPVEAVELVHDGTVMRTVAVAGKRDDVAAAHPGVEGAERSEFFAMISSLGLSPTFEVMVQAVLSDGDRLRLGVIRGRRALLRSQFEPRLVPLMLTSTGRVGSTVLMNALGAHPQIAAYPPFQKEPRVASYWMTVFTTLSEPASYVRQLAPGGPLHNGWWLGTGEPVPRASTTDEIERWMAVEAVESLAALCQGRIEALYREIAESQGRPDAIYFAEKFRTDAIPALMWELYPRAREVILVRDFRDVACSVLATSAKRRGLAQRGDPRTVLDDIQSRTGSVVKAWRERSRRAHLVRYEDLIERPLETLESLVAYLELDSASNSIEAMVRALSEESAASDRHRTTDAVEASIGRWRRDLDAEQQREFGTALREGLETFGYS
jgi:hypothetical protein